MMIVKYDRARNKGRVLFPVLWHCLAGPAVAQYWVCSSAFTKERDRQEQVKNRLFHVCFVTIFQRKTGCIRHTFFGPATALLSLCTGYTYLQKKMRKERFESVSGVTSCAGGSL